MATEPRVNDRIRIPRVRVVGFDGQQVGVMETPKALVMAQDQDLDLVEVAPQADPPVARIMDYGKYKYEQAVRQRESRKRQTQVTVKEMKMRPKIDPHDYETKKGHVERFLRQGSKVKVTIMFRGREIAHTELGRKLLDALSSDLEGIAKIESFPKQVDSRNMTMVLGPVKEAITQKAATEPRRPKASGPPAEEEHSEDRGDAPAVAAVRRRPLKVTRAEGG